MLDVSRHLQRVPAEGLPELRKDIAEGAGSLYSTRAAETLLAILDEEMLLSLRDNRIIKTANRLIPPLTVDITSGAIMNLAEFITRIIDYKSEFTRRHSTQIAYKAWLMGGYYNYAPDLRAEFYLAAALHDFGKLATPTRILEKPGKLDNDEFRIITDHVRITYELLKGIVGLEELRDWAANHHEKLDGSGYPFGKKAEELDFNSRLMACIDIYQAVSEARPYHPQRNHRDTMEILYPMVQQGLLDPGIIRDMDQVLVPWDGGDLPQPNRNA
jgi:HD-GYP domain-containing protein (c-di-GMP phosphodiesterase class II)